MRSFLLGGLLVCSLVSCGTDPEPVAEIKDTLITSLDLPSVSAGIVLDTIAPYVKMAVVRDSAGTVQRLMVETNVTADSIYDTVNVYADGRIRAAEVDSIIDSLCYGKDLRLVGLLNNIPVAVPFHTLHRFPALTDTVVLNNPSLVQSVLVTKGEVYINDSLYQRESLERFLTTFYGNAFRWEQRSWYPWRSDVQSLRVFGQEAPMWDGVNFRATADSAFQLAAYNEFVNRMEVFQKVGEYYLLQKGLFSVSSSGDAEWGSVVKVFSMHLSAQQQLRREAVEYLANKVANKGEGQEGFTLTGEDLLLLYPDRLRWNGRMSGTTEHRYDPFLLMSKYAEPPVPVLRPGDSGGCEAPIRED